MGAEIVIATASAEIAAEPEEKPTETRSSLELQEVIMAVPREVLRAGAEAEVVKMTADTHAATEIAPTKVAAGMAISTEAMVGLAHAREAQIDIIALEETVGTEMTKTVASLGKIDETEMRDVEQVEAQRERPHPL